MKILKYKTIENIRYVSKDIPISKKDIVIIEKEDDSHEFDIFESKEYIYEKPDNIGFNSALNSIKKNNNDIELELSKIEKDIKALDIKPIDLDINKSIKPLINTVDISKELDEDIYSDLKSNIEKSVDDDKYFDNPYKTAIKLEQEGEKDELKNTKKSRVKPFQKFIKKFKK